MRPAFRAVAGVGAAPLAASLWLPWFTRRLPPKLLPLGVDADVSGWAALRGLGFLVLLAVLVAVAGALGRVPAYGLVVAGALVLMADVAATVDRIDTAGSSLGSTSPRAGLVLAYAGAAAIVLAGIAALLDDARTRAAAARSASPG